MIHPRKNWIVIVEEPTVEKSKIYVTPQNTGTFFGIILSVNEEDIKDFSLGEKIIVRSSAQNQKVEQDGKICHIVHTLDILGKISS